MKPRILLVDDEVNLLEGLKRQLFRRYDVTLANSPSEALEMCEGVCPFSVVISDMRMPNMNGVEFLQKMQDRCSQSRRIMLTGNNDQQTAVEAVNDAHVFKFLTKPCTVDDLVSAIDEAVLDYESETKEQEIITKTLASSVKILLDTLSITNPTALSIGQRIRPLTRMMAKVCLPEFVVDLELAAMLSHIGCVGFTDSLQNRIRKGGAVQQEELDEYAKHPEVGASLLNNVARLQQAAHFVLHQSDAWNPTPGSESTPEYAQRLGGNILRAAIEFDRRFELTGSYQDALDSILADSENYAAEVLESLESAVLSNTCPVPKYIKLTELLPGQILADHLLSNAGAILISKGQALTESSIKKLQVCDAQVGVRQPIAVVHTGLCLSEE